MKKLILLALLFLSINLNAQNCNTSKNRIIIVGDSWAYFPWSYGSLDDNLNKYGFTDAKAYSNSALSVNGRKAKNMTDTTIIADIQQAINANPYANIINLSIGGNDFLGAWNNSMTQMQTDSILDIIIDRTDTIIKIINAMKPGIQIYLPMYDFPNFGESIGIYPSPSSHPFYSAWNDMGQPTFMEINTQLLNYAQKITTLVNTYPNVYFEDASGLMQNIYGQTSPLQVAPGGTYPADSVPVPGGYPAYPSPLTAMADYGFFYDAFHFSNGAYKHFYDFHFKNYFFEALRRDRDTVLSSIDVEDGTVTSSSTIDSIAIIGNDSSYNKSATILSFNTANFPSGEQLGLVSLFLRRNNLDGSKPINGKALVSIKANYFGTANTLDAGDYSDNGTIQDTLCVYGDLNSNGAWMRIDITDSLLNHFNLTGNTQIKIEMIDNTIGHLYFADGSDSMYMPQMDVYYQSTTVSVKEEEKITSFNVYPNPTENILYLSIDKTFAGQAQLIDLSGKTSTVNINNNQLDVSSLSNGVYFLKITIEGKVSVAKFVKG